jgi:hypothetical protein
VFYSAFVQSFRQLPGTPTRVFHVWVKLDLDGPRPPLPGLVLDWRLAPTGWEAWVVTVETYSTGTSHGSMVRQGWRPVAYLRPAGSPPPALADWRHQPIHGQSNSASTANGSTPSP